MAATFFAELEYDRHDLLSVFKEYHIAVIPAFIHLRLFPVQEPGQLADRFFLRGVYHAVSKKHLQGYLNEYAWRYSERNNPAKFSTLLRRATVL